jgi:hypothetical protein
LHPEWCAAFNGVRLADGSVSVLDKTCENRDFPPWSTIAPRRDPRANSKTGPLPFLPGPWFAMHAGKSIGGKPGNDGALFFMVDMAREAGWTSARSGPEDLRLTKGTRSMLLHPRLITLSSIVALVRVTRVDRPGVWRPWRFTEQWGWYLDVRPLPVPVPCSGAQGLWTVPEDVAAKVLEQGVNHA